MSLPEGYTVRPLAPEEFPLASGPEGVIWPSGAVLLGCFSPENRLVGRIGVLLLPHIEGLWVDPNERGVGDIARALHTQIEDASRELGRQFVFAYVPEDLPGMGSHLRRAGYEPLNFTVLGKKL